MNKPRIFLSLTFLLLFVSVSAADTIYVSSNFGNDGRSRGQAQNRNTPFRTIQRGVDQAFAGDEVVVLNGNYREYVTMRRSGQRNAIITLRSENKEGAKLVGSIEGYDRSYLKIEGFDISNRLLNAPQAKGITFVRCHHLVIRDNRVHDCRGGGISCDQSSWLLIEWNIALRNAFWHPDQHSGISVYQPQARGPAESNGWGIMIRNNTSIANENKVNNPNFGRPTDGNGIAIDDSKNVQAGGNGQEYPYRTLITNNLCFLNGGQGIHCYLSNDVFIRNNTCYKDMKSFDFGGEVSISESSRCYVYNNILFARTGKNVALQFDSDVVWWDYNILYNGPTFQTQNGPNTLYTHPLFRLNTLRIRSGSPAIDSGWTHPAIFPLDIDGQPRVINGKVDRGATEFSFAFDN
ncbi:MAG: right-handed parallel beta-helix repeat-containing protein [Mariniblastus sp.]